MSLDRVIVGSFVFAVIALMASVLAISRHSHLHRQPSSTLIGDTLTAGHVRSFRGDLVDLRREFSGGPAVVFVIGPGQCIPCTGFLEELQIVSGNWPHLRTAIVAGERSYNEVRSYVVSRRLQDAVYLDPEGTLIAGLGASNEPLVVVIDAAGKILLTHTQQRGDKEVTRIGQVLASLTEILNP